ncbi:hypothetical protein V5O48_008438 [Marasmius crinis-equi]|uniref:DUF6534 domain-containing protein n=1 Tax=Marasmius crinis-equi TaxID=585013 RepID=A0ABR3FDW9_9AGAR
MSSIALTYGALLIGTLFAAIFSGMLAIQYIFYGRGYGSDPLSLKAFVFAIWLLDGLHNASVWSSIWTWFIDDFGAPERLDTIPIGIPLSIIVTGFLTFSVHCFYVYRMYHLSRRGLALALPILILAALRLVSALTTAYLMMKHPSLSNFKFHHRWIFSAGLGLSSAVDILITVIMMAVLRHTRSKALSLDQAISTLIVYTMENGAITTAATVVSMICWLTMDNLVFLALHFIIAKRTSPLTFTKLSLNAVTAVLLISLRKLRPCHAQLPK